MPKILVTKDGARYENPEERIDGVLTDAGLIPWDDVLGFRVWHAPTQRYMSIPLD